MVNWVLLLMWGFLFTYIRSRNHITAALPKGSFEDGDKDPKAKAKGQALFGGGEGW